METKHEATREVKHEAPKLPDEQKLREKKAKTKRAVKVACDALHALRPQPRADDIDAVLGQIKAMEEPPADDAAAKSKAEELYKKSQPADAKAA